MRTFMVEAVDEVVEAGLLLQEVLRGRFGGLDLKCEVHALMAAILLGMPGLDALDLMNRYLHDRNWLATENTTVADIACYPYLLLASEGGVDIRPFSAVRAWMERLESLPGFWPMPRIPNLPDVPILPHSRFLGKAG